MQGIIGKTTTFVSKFFNYLIKHVLKDERGRVNPALCLFAK